jgi:hypothetical protein
MDGRAALAMTAIFWVHPDQAASIHLAKKSAKVWPMIQGCGFYPASHPSDQR